MGLFSKDDKLVDFKNEYAMMESQMIATPKALLKGLGVKEVNLNKIPSYLSEDQQKEAAARLLKQRDYNVLLLRDFVANDQINFFKTGEVNLNLRFLFKDYDISDSILISKTLKANKQAKIHAEYSERVMWNYFNDMERLNRKAFCVSGSLNQIDNLLLLKINRKSDGAILSNGASYFPVKLYEKFFEQIKTGNNVVVV